MFYDNLSKACEMRGTQITPLLIELKISTGNIGKWKKGGDISSKNLIKIADKLNVSVDYLLYGKDRTFSTSFFCANETEENMLRQFRQLSPYQKEKCVSYIQGMYDASDHSGENARELSG